MTENVEGVTAEETTVEAVENQPEKTIDVVEEHDSPESEQQESAPEGLSDEEVEKYLNDPKIKAELDRRTKEAVKEKTPRQRAAIHALEEQNKQLREKISKLESIETPEKPNISDYDSDEEYQDALLEHKLKVKSRDEKLEEAKTELQTNEQKAQAEIQAETAEKIQSYQAREAEYTKSNPDYVERVKTVQSYIDMLPHEEVNGRRIIKDEGGKAFLETLLETGPELMAFVGSDPEKYIEPLFGKPPAFIKRKLEGYVTQIQSSQQKPPEVKTLPDPPSKTKGGAMPSKDPAKMSGAELLKEIRNQ